MAETAALLVDNVLPQQPVRQWLLSLPFALRYLLATRPEVIERGDGSVEINLGFRLIQTNSIPGYIYGDSVPPLAVSMGTDKIWDEFERVAFVQSKTLR